MPFSLIASCSGYLRLEAAFDGPVPAEQPHDVRVVQLLELALRTRRPALSQPVEQVWDELALSAQLLDYLRDSGMYGSTMMLHDVP